MGETETQSTIDRQDPTAPSRSNMSAYLTQTNQYFDQAKVPAPLPYQPAPAPVPGPSSETNAAPAPGSFGDRLSPAAAQLGLLSPAFRASVARDGTGLTLMNLAHGILNPQSAQTSEQAAGDMAGNVSSGNTTWEAAQQNDQTQPINPNQLPKEDIAHKVQRGLAGTLGDLFSMGPNSEVEHAKRMEEENRTGALSALTNIQMLREQQMLHKGAQEQINEAAKTGADQFALLSAAPEAKVITEGKTSDQIQQMLRDKSLNTSTMQIFQTGRVQVGTDKTGTPMFRSTYSVLIPGGPVTLGLTKVEETGNALEGAKMTPEQREAAKQQQGTLDYLNANIPGMHMQPGQVLPSMQLAALMQKANSNARAFEQRDHWLAQQAATKHEAELTAGDKEFMANTSMLKILNQYTDHNEDKFAIQKGYVALENAMAGSDDQAKALRQELGTDWREKFEHAYGGHEYFEKRMAEYDKQTKETADAQITAINNPAKDPESVKPLLRTPMDTALKAMDQANVEKKKADAIMRDPNADPEAKTKAQETYNRADQFYNQNKASYDKMQGATNTADEIIKNKVNEAGAKSGAEAAAKQKAEQGAMAGNTNLQGEAYLNSITDIGLKNSLIAVSEGREQRSPRQLQDRQGNETIFAKQIHLAFPDFDIANAMAYPKAVQEWKSTKPGTPGGQLNNGATALKHLKELDTLFKANPNWSKVPQSEAYVRYNNLKDTLADELMKFYGAPSTTEVIDAYKGTIASFLNREAAISEQAKAMAEKFGSLEQSWNNISPRPKTFRPPMPQIDDGAKGALNYFAPDWVRAHPQFQVGYDPSANAINTGRVDLGVSDTSGAIQNNQPSPLVRKVNPFRHSQPQQ